MGIKENLRKIEEAIQNQEITLVAVTKERTCEEIEEAYRLGLRDFGESRIQEALKKIGKFPGDIRWHFIGHLQKNKVNKVVGRFTLIHSVDTPELAKKISEASLAAGLVTSILLQANTSGEKTKEGLSPESWKKSFLSLLDLSGISIRGLMTMAPLTDDKEVIVSCFRRLRELRDELQLMAHERANLSILSMGMSHDYEVALREGATMVRIGRALFGFT